MLKEITIESYKSLKNVTVQFKDGLNIIIGKNGSGKSNLLEFVSKHISLRPIQINARNTSVKYAENYDFIISGVEKQIGVETKVTIKRQIIFADSKQTFRVNISIDKNSSGEMVYSYFFPVNNEDEQTRAIVSSELWNLDVIDNLQFLKYHIPSDISWLDRPFAFDIQGERRGLYDSENGSENSIRLCDNLEMYLAQKFFAFDFNTLDELKKFFNNYFKSFIIEEGIEDYLNKFSPIESIRLSPNINTYEINTDYRVENLFIEFYVNKEWIPWRQLSDGTKRLFYIITEFCLQENGLMLLEEPELGIHPHQLYRLMEFIKEQSKHKQIIISTHSPLILDTLEADELDRIIVAKIENGGSKFVRLTEEQTEHAKTYMHEEMDLSFYWLHADMEE